MSQKGLFVTVIFFIILLILSVTLTSIILSRPRNDESRDGFTEDFLADTVPAVYSIGSPVQDTKPEVSTSKPKPIHSVVISWIFEKNSVYVRYGGTLKAFIENNGTSRLYIYGLGIKPDWPINASNEISKENYISIDVGIFINVSEKKYVGLLHFPGPAYSSEFDYSMIFWGYQENEYGSWNDCGIQLSTPKTIDVVPLPFASEYKQHYNLPHYFDKVNEIVDPTSEKVINLSRKLAGEYSGPFNIYQVSAIFDYIYNNVKYISDPSNTENYWCTPEQTLELGGDCEDFSTLLASMLVSIGGAVRMYLTDSHAFLALYIGNESEVQPIIEAIRDYYQSNIPIFWLSDELGAWLILDTIGSIYTGGLPLGASPVRTQEDIDSDLNDFSGSWDFIDTENLYIVDIKP
jgi:hypothetical protein